MLNTKCKNRSKAARQELLFLSVTSQSVFHSHNAAGEDRHKAAGWSRRMLKPSLRLMSVETFLRAAENTADETETRTVMPVDGMAE